MEKGGFIIIGVFFILVGTIFLVNRSSSAASAGIRENGSTASLTVGPAPSDEAARIDWFWMIIENSRNSRGDQVEQLVAIKAQLSGLPTEDIVTFGAVFSRLMCETYSWDLWGAAYVIMGGASDDSFEYFRVWMLSRGHSFFEAARKDPDSLATLIPPNFHEVPEFELLAYAASEVWAERTGKKPNEMPTQPDMIYSTNPVGTPFSENEASLEARYPKLWKRFADSPLE